MHTLTTLTYIPFLVVLASLIAACAFRMLASLLALAYISINGLNLCHYFLANLSNEVNPKHPSVRTRTAFTKVSEAATSLGLNDVTTNITNKSNALKSPTSRFELTESPSLSRFLIHVFISVDFCES